MSLNLNHVTLAGHLTRNPDVKVIGGQKHVAVIAIAVNRRWKTPDGEQKQEATFVDCEAWGRTAELAGQYLTKGSPVYVEGRLKLDSWQDKDGQRHTRMKVVIETLQFLSRAGGEKAGAPAKAPDAAADEGEGELVAVAAPAKQAGSQDEPPF